MKRVFLADIMLKKLCRWLRIFGVSTIYAGNYTEDDDEIIKLAIEKKMVLLTADEALYNKARDYVKAILLEGTDLVAQIEQINKEVKLGLSSKFLAKTLCAQCNSKLKVVGKDAVRGKVFTSVLRNHRKFWLCQECGKIYWQGSHWKKIRKTAGKITKKTGRK